MKILVVDLGPAADDVDLVGELREFGHEVEIVPDYEEATLEQAAGASAEAILVRLESHPARAIDVADELSRKRLLRTASLLFVGGSEIALTAARTRFPKASFSRRDAVHTSLASLDA